MTVAENFAGIGAAPGAWRRAANRCSASGTNTRQRERVHRGVVRSMLCSMLATSAACTTATAISSRSRRRIAIAAIAAATRMAPTASGRDALV